MNNFKRLLVWQKSMDLVQYIYSILETFPSNEKYALSDQMRRSAVSIPSNIAEGSERESKKEFIRFINISLGSLSELETQIMIAKRIGYIDSYNEELIDDVRNLIRGLLFSLKNK